MSNNYFQFKKFRINQANTSMKVTTDACLFGAWIARELNAANKNLLDIGAGTGLLSLMIAQESYCNIEAIEIEPHAAAEAKENIAASPWNDRINIIEADVRNIPIKKYDCMISNPPFYENDVKAPAVAKNIAHHSQELKMDELVGIISKGLGTEGAFFLLLPFRRKEEILLMIENAGLFMYEIVQVYHSAEHGALRIMIKGGKKKGPVLRKNFYIKDEKNEYSAEFVSLLKDYYLYL